jgi:DNA-binding NtrC family response regulator
MADGGTVFLGDVCEMSVRMQARLLRVVESKEIHSVGSDRVESAIDLRIIAATSRELDGLVASKAFREDLYCRLNTIEVRIPPLRSRREDIPVLLGHFLQAYSERHGVTPPTIAPEVMRYLVEYEWTGNLRQLKQVVERLLVRAQGSITRVTDLPPEIVARPWPDAHETESSGSAAIQGLFDRMAKQRESFWSVVYPAFMARDLTRNDLRLIVRKGLQETAGSYKMLVELLNMHPTDYRRFLSFLRKHGCHVPFQRFRTIQPWHRDVPAGTFPAPRVAEHSQPPDSMQR